MLFWHNLSFLLLYTSISRSHEVCAGLCYLVAGSRLDEGVDLYWRHSYPISSRLYPSAVHKRASFQLAPFKQRSDLLSSSSHFYKNQHFYPVTLFVYLILFIYIILKVIPTYIYLIKAYSLDIAFKKFHKHSRSSFREIVFLHENLKKTCRSHVLDFLSLL